MSLRWERLAASGKSLGVAAGKCCRADRGRHSILVAAPICDDSPDTCGLECAGCGGADVDRESITSSRRLSRSRKGCSGRRLSVLQRNIGLPLRCQRVCCISWQAGSQSLIQKQGRAMASVLVACGSPLTVRSRLSVWGAPKFSVIRSVAASSALSAGQRDENGSSGNGAVVDSESVEEGSGSDLLVGGAEYNLDQGFITVEHEESSVSISSAQNTGAENEERPSVSLIVFDIETTGFSRIADRIVEFAARDLAGGENSTLQTLVNPGKSVGDSANVHHISDEMVNNPAVPKWDEVAPVIVDFVESRRKGKTHVVLIAHNGRNFDVPFIINHFQDSSVKLPAHWLFLDTLPMAKDALIAKGMFTGKSSLQFLHQHYNLPPFQQTHRAMDDVHLLVSVLQNLLKDLRLTPIDLLDRAFKASEYKSNAKLMKGQVGRVNEPRAFSETSNRFMGLLGLKEQLSERVFGEATQCAEIGSEGSTKEEVGYYSLLEKLSSASHEVGISKASDLDMFPGDSEVGRAQEEGSCPGLLIRENVEEQSSNDEVAFSDSRTVSPESQDIFLDIEGIAPQTGSAAISELSVVFLSREIGSFNEAPNYNSQPVPPEIQAEESSISISEPCEIVASPSLENIVSHSRFPRKKQERRYERPCNLKFTEQSIDGEDILTHYPDIALLTPMMRQYVETKQLRPQFLLLSRVGDFFEAFFQDARKLAQACNVRLTAVDGGKMLAKKVPMAGVPAHRIDVYLKMLLDKGISVVKQDQVAADVDVKQGNLIHREVTAVLTPGTLLEHGMIEDCRNNFLVSILPPSTESGVWGLAYADISTGEFRVTHSHGRQSLAQEILRLQPSEVLFPENTPCMEDEGSGLVYPSGMPSQFCYAIRSPSDFYPSYAKKKLQSCFGVESLEGLGLQDLSYGLRAAGGLLSYLQQTLKVTTSSIPLCIPVTYSINNYMLMNETVRSHLELFHTSRSGRDEGSLLWAMDHTKTAMGGRMLRQWLLLPLLSHDEIRFRHSAVEILCNDHELREHLLDKLSLIADIERLTGRVAWKKADARDLLTLAHSIQVLPSLRNLLFDLSENKYLRFLEDTPPEVFSVADRILTMLVEEPSRNISNGGLVNRAADEEVDLLQKDVESIDLLIGNYEKLEQERTGISSLEIGYMRPAGHFISVRKSRVKQERIPVYYSHVQSLKNEDRFVTQELLEYDRRRLAAVTKLVEREEQLFLNLREEMGKLLEALRDLNHRIAALDVLTNFAELAVERKYSCPEMLEEGRDISIVKGRHPVVETVLPSNKKFVPNSTYLGFRQSDYNAAMGEESAMMSSSLPSVLTDGQDVTSLEQDQQEAAEISEDESLWPRPDLIILTGPNASGKSCYLRQIGLIQLLAQAGSFVPAEKTRLTIADGLFTRVGSVDDLAAGQSSFKVEMMETAHILNNATSRSLVLLDEVGRGTGAQEGEAIARAIMEYLSQHIHARTVFSTHYHSLHALDKEFPNIANFHFGATEDGNGALTFDHSVQPGYCLLSYGIAVARMSNIPQWVCSRAEELHVAAWLGSDVTPCKTSSLFESSEYTSEVSVEDRSEGLSCLQEDVSSSPSKLANVGIGITNCQKGTEAIEKYNPISGTAKDLTDVSDDGLDMTNTEPWQKDLDVSSAGCNSDSSLAPIEPIGQNAVSYDSEVGQGFDRAVELKTSGDPSECPPDTDAELKFSEELGAGIEGGVLDASELTYADTISVKQHTGLKSTWGVGRYQNVPRSTGGIERLKWDVWFGKRNHKGSSNGISAQLGNSPTEAIASQGHPAENDPTAEELNKNVKSADACGHMSKKDLDNVWTLVCEALQTKPATQALAKQKGSLVSISKTPEAVLVCLSASALFVRKFRQHEHASPLQAAFEEVLGTSVQLEISFLGSSAQC